MAHVQPGQDACRAAFPECVIDTGSHLSVIPEYVWGLFKSGIVTPLPFDPAMPHALRSVSLAGGTFSYRLGELTVRLRDPGGGVLDVTLLAQLTDDGGSLTLPVTLGLRGGVIDGRILRGEPDPTAPFAQAWLLEDP